MVCGLRSMTQELLHVCHQPTDPRGPAKCQISRSKGNALVKRLGYLKQKSCRLVK